MREELHGRSLHQTRLRVSNSRVVENKNEEHCGKDKFIKRKFSLKSFPWVCLDQGFVEGYIKGKEKMIVLKSIWSPCLYTIWVL